LAEGLAHHFNRLGLKRARVSDVVRVASLDIHRQRRRAVGVNGAQKQLGRFESGRLQDGRAQRLGGPVVEPEVVDRDEHEALAVLLECQGARRQRIVHAPEKVPPTRATGQHHRLGRGNVAPGDAGPQACRPRRQAVEPEREPGQQRERKKAGPIGTRIGDRIHGV